jgi:hypothetical protein
MCQYMSHTHDILFKSYDSKNDKDTLRVLNQEEKYFLKFRSNVINISYSKKFIYSDQILSS